MEYTETRKTSDKINQTEMITKNCAPLYSFRFSVQHPSFDSFKVLAVELPAVSRDSVDSLLNIKFINFIDPVATRKLSYETIVVNLLDSSGRTVNKILYKASFNHIAYSTLDYSDHNKIYSIVSFKIHSMDIYFINKYENI